ncbi:MAG: hypothetical protein QY324_06965 [Anaerolineales bacterium]|nr:MAG: hypothetical protein QY324_06965 [Anaerolineales bacterium]
MKIKTRFLNLTLALCLIASAFALSPASPAEAADESQGVSPQGFLNPDGTLNLSKDLRGSLDLSGWDVSLDPARGPLFAPLGAPAVGDWENLGGGALPVSPNNFVSAVAVSGSDVYIGGSFTDLNDDPTMDYIAKWDGTNWSALGSNGAGDGSINNSVNAIAVSGTDLYVGGDFEDVNNGGTALNAADYIAKWDGANWSALGSNGAGDGSISPYSEVYAVAVSGSDVYVGGWFESVNNRGTVLNEADNIAKWDGTDWSALGSNGAGEGSLNNDVYAIAVSGTDVYVGGAFKDVNNSGMALNEADNIAKWDGTNWSALGSNGAGDGSLNFQVDAIAVSGSDLYVGGDFYDVNNGGAVLTAADKIAKWDGTDWSALSSNGAGNGSLNDAVYAIVVSGTDLYVGGDFEDVNNGGTVLNEADNIAKWDGTNWSALGSNGAGDGSLNFRVNAIAVSGTDLYVGGYFYNVNNGGAALNASNFTRWDGANWHAISPPFQGALNDTVYAIAINGTDVYVGGAFTNANGIASADYIAKWDGANWSALGSNGAGDGSINDWVRAIAVSGTDVYVGGEFEDVNNVGTVLNEADYVAKWDGTDWSALSSNGAGNGSLNNNVNAIAVSGSSVYVGGNFKDVNNGGTVLNEADYIAKWDGTNWSALGSDGAGGSSLSPYSEVNAIAVSGSDVYVGGYFEDVNNGGTVLNEADNIAKWDGTDWSALGSNGAGNGSLNDSVYAIAVSGSDVYVGGYFYNVNNGGTKLGAADYIAKWDGTDWSALGSNGAGDGSINDWVRAIAVSGSNVYVGGNFKDMNNGGTVLNEADNIAKWDGTDWSALGSNGAGDGSLNDWMRAIAVGPGALYAGGDFINVNNNGVVLPYADRVAAYGIDVSAPTVVSITRADANPTSALSANFTVTFSEDVTGVDQSDFTLTKTGNLSGFSVASVTPVDARTYTVAVTVGSGNGSLRLDVSAASDIKDLNNNLLLNLPYIDGETYTVRRRLFVRSAGAQDGWTLESFETSNMGGTFNSTAITLLLGDDAVNRQYRSILSFNTSSLPDNAVITKVTLKVRLQKIVGGGNPVNALQGFMADVRKGVFGTSALQVIDFQAPASKTVGPLKPALVGGWYTLNLPPAKASVNKLATGSGLTQIRLRFKLDDNNNAVANYLSLYSGNAAVGTRPQLIVEYYVP